VNRSGRLIEIGPGSVDFRIFQIPPRARQRESENLAGVLVLLDRYAGLRLDTHDPKSTFNVGLEQLELNAFLIGNEWQLLFTAMQGSGNGLQNCTHTSPPKSGAPTMVADGPICNQRGLLDGQRVHND
jgi:hypothetical protein